MEALEQVTDLHYQRIAVSCVAIPSHPFFMQEGSTASSFAEIWMVVAWTPRPRLMGSRVCSRVCPVAIRMEGEAKRGADGVERE